MESYNWKDSLHIERWPVNSPHKWPLKRMMSSCQDRWLPLGYILNKRLNKQSWGWWFETPSCSLWRHCNGIYRTLGQHFFLYARFFWPINGAELSLANRQFHKSQKAPVLYPQCFIHNRNVHISVLNEALWDMEKVHSWICEIGQLYQTPCKKFVTCRRKTHTGHGN